MPNQRKKCKRKIGLWVEEAQEARLKEIAEKTGMTVSDLIKEAINQAYNKKGTSK